MSKHNPSVNKNFVLYHPLYVLQARVQRAYELVVDIVSNRRTCYQYPDYEKTWVYPAEHALNLAYSAADGAERWLRYGLEDLAGVFENDLRNVLHTLLKYFSSMQHLPYNDDRETIWEKNVLELQRLFVRINHVPVNEKDMTRWCEYLVLCHHSLTETHEAMGLLLQDVQNGANPKGSIHYLAIEKSLPVFEKKLSIIKHGLLFSRESTNDESTLVLLERLPGILRHRYRQIIQPSIEQNSKLDKPKESRAYSLTKQLLELLDRAVEIGKETINQKIADKPKDEASKSSTEEKNGFGNVAVNKDNHTILINGAIVFNSNNYTIFRYFYTLWKNKPEPVDLEKLSGGRPGRDVARDIKNMLKSNPRVSFLADKIKSQRAIGYYFDC